MLRLLKRLVVFGLAAIAGCSGTPTEAPPPDPLELVTTAAENIRATDTFRMLVESTGAPYFVATDLGAVIFRRAVAQYVAPDVMEATVRLIAAGLPTNVGIFSRGDNQWYRNDILTGGRWYNAQFSPGFNPESLIASETGFQQSLRAMIDIEYAGEMTLEDGSPVWFLRARANGQDVTALLAGLVEMNGVVDVEIYVHRERQIPVRFVIIQPETVSETQPEPTVWTIDIYDIDAPPDIDDPEAGAQAQPATAAPTDASA